MYRALRRHGLGARHERLGVLERLSAERAGLLTEQTRREIQKARCRLPPPRRSEAARRAFGLDCFDIGKLKGLNRVC